MHVLIRLSGVAALLRQQGSLCKSYCPAAAVPMTGRGCRCHRSVDGWYDAQCSRRVALFVVNCWEFIVRPSSCDIGIVMARVPTTIII